MKRLVLSVVAFCFFASVAYAGTVGPRKGREMSPYPEYSGVFKKSDIQYSKPNFGGKKHYWVRYWNAGGFYEKDGEMHWDGVAYDGHLLYNPRVVFDKKANDYRYYFIDDNFKNQKDPMNRPAERFFYGYQVVDDPRLTNWWMSFAGDDKAKDIYEAIENGAMTKKHSEITGVILKNMIYSSGIIKRVEMKNVKPKQIKEAINDYTNIALTYNLQRTYAVMAGKIKMSRDSFANLRAGDVIKDYYWFRFGPFPLAIHELYVVETEEKPIKRIFVKFWNKGKTEEMKREEISDYTNFMVIIKSVKKN